MGRKNKNKKEKLKRKKDHGRNYESDNEYQPRKAYMLDEISEYYQDQRGR